MLCQSVENSERALPPQIVDHHINLLGRLFSKRLCDARVIVAQQYAHICIKAGQCLRIAARDDDLPGATVAGNLHRKLPGTARGPVDEYGLAWLKLRACHQCGPRRHPRIRHRGGGGVVQPLR
ncbi:hypothetical protein D3C81_1540980 [compost metagenome]